MDRYVTILKRKRSPNYSNMEYPPKIVKNPMKICFQNRFSLLATEDCEPVETQKPFKPPAIYLREESSNEVVENLVSLIEANSFYGNRIKRGLLYEIKMQLNHENDFRKIVANFDVKKKKFVCFLYL